jgi:hypothetical protein
LIRPVCDAEVRIMTRAPAETDPRFYGGSWVGYTLQPSDCSTRHATLMTLTFAGGIVKGNGSDESGVFSVQGRYDVRDGKCIWIQSYKGRRDVIYNGYCDGQGMWGMWFRPKETGPDWKGGFHLVPEGADEPTPLPTQRMVDTGEAREGA